MKTKIIYISGSEIFEINDIRSAFEEVRNALKLGPDTVLFGVPVDAEDAGFTQKNDDLIHNSDESKTVEVVQEVIENQTVVEPEPAVVMEPEIPEIRIESVIETQPKKRGRPHKEKIIEEKTEDITEDNKSDDIAIESIDRNETQDDVVVPILSVLATKTEEVVEDIDDTADSTEDSTEDTEEDSTQNIEIIPEITENAEVTPDLAEEPQTIEEADDDDDARLEKLLSAMTPLEEDILEDGLAEDTAPIVEEDSTDATVDATLEQLASEVIENQDKIAAEAKSTSRSKIGKLRNILPFKQSKHKDSGLGDLFGWAGIAANDEDFSVPGFFTSAASKK